MSSSAVSYDNADGARPRRRAAVNASYVPEEPAKEPTVYVQPIQAPTGDGSLISSWRTLEAYVMPLLFTAIGAYVRLYRIGLSTRVVWDEAHFGKFGSFYLKHQYYFDVHPPLGKMLCGLSGYIAGYNGSFGFESGAAYPDWVNYSVMRQFNALFSILTVPTAYYTAKAAHFSLPAVWLTTLMVALELSFVTLARFILLDSMLILFTTTTFLGLLQFHRQQSKPFGAKWFFWLTWTGVSIGLTTSVKMVGLFVTGVVGIYTVGDLWIRLGDRKQPLTKYALHWVARIVSLIVIPTLIFMACFKVHFMLLTHTGDGVASMSSLFKANLIGEETDLGPMDLAYGSRITLKNQGLGGGLLHSHVQTFPEGSKQQQITTYGHMDSNNEWVVDYPRWQDPYNHNRDVQKVVEGDVIRLSHFNTLRNLHSHSIRAAVTKGAWEVSGYGNDTIGDEKDNWVLEIAESLGDEDPTMVHPLTTSVRLRHEALGCYLTANGNQLPEWGFRQGEVSCVPGVSKRDKNSWWNIEQHWNQRLPDSYNRTLPRTKFLRDFVQLNVAQMASNNALVPDEDKIDDLASSWWQWPIMHRGLRMCGWGDDYPRYYLLGTVSTVWLTTFGVFTYLALTAWYIIRWQRSFTDFTQKSMEEWVTIGGFSFLGWLLHYLPFIVMSRVTYLHHYMPALYFAIFLFVFQVDQIRCSKLRPVVFLALFAVTISCFVYFFPIASGMLGAPSDYEYMNWFKSWHLAA